MYNPGHLTIQPMVLSPSGDRGLDGLGSPLTPSTFAPLPGPHVRAGVAGRRESVTNMEQQQQQQHIQQGGGGVMPMPVMSNSNPYSAHTHQPTHTQNDPWSMAAQNPFPHHQNGATMNYYAPPTNTASQPRVQYDPNTSSFTLPAGGGGGVSPPPEGYLPSTMKGGAGKGHGKNTVLLFKSFLVDRKRLIKWGAAAATVMLTAVIMFIVFRGRSATAIGGGTQVGAKTAQEAYVSPPISAGRKEPEQRPPTSAQNHRRADDGSYKEQADAYKAKQADNIAKGKKSSPTILEKGLEEIAKMKANLKEMKAKLKTELATKAREAKEKLLGKSKDTQQGEENDSVSTEEDEIQANSIFEGEQEGEVNDTGSTEALEKEIEEWREQLKGAEEEVAAAKKVKQEPMKVKRKNGQEGEEEPSVAAKKGRDDKNKNKYDWFVSEWSDCNVSCGIGSQTREVLCKHSISNDRVSARVCNAQKDLIEQPRDVRECEMPPCETATTETSSKTEPEVIPPPPRTVASVVVESATAPSNIWPTLAQYVPEWSAVTDRSSCPIRKWGKDFLESRWVSTKELQCGVDINPDEHASLEYIRIPIENLPPSYVLARSTKEVGKEQLSDSYLKLRHGLFHPTAVRYSTPAGSSEKGKASTSSIVKETIPSSDLPSTTETKHPDWAVSLDCTARPELKERKHVDKKTEQFLESLHFLNPHAPPLVTPSDPRSKSIFTRAFDRMTDAEFETTTIFLHRNCPPPYSAAQCLPDLFAVYTVAQSLRIEFSTLRIVFLDDEEESPYFPLWQKLVSGGSMGASAGVASGTTSPQVFTRQMWSTLRVTPFDEDDVYLTNAIYLMPSGIPILFSLGESFQSIPVDVKSNSLHPIWKESKCLGKSPLHIGFNALLADLYLGQGASAQSDAQRVAAIRSHLQKHVIGGAKLVEDHSGHNHPALLVLADGGGGAPMPSTSKHIVKLSASGAKLTNVEEIEQTISEAYPAAKLQPYPRLHGFQTQLQLLTHSSLLIGVHQSLAFNVLMFASHPEQIHVVELTPSGKYTESPSAQELMELPWSQGLNIPIAPASSGSHHHHGKYEWKSLLPQENAIFSPKSLCMRLGCASYKEILIEGQKNSAIADVSAILDHVTSLASILHLQPVQVPSEPTLEEFDAPQEEAESITFLPPTEEVKPEVVKEPVLPNAAAATTAAAGKKAPSGKTTTTKSTGKKPATKKVPSKKQPKPPPKPSKASPGASKPRTVTPKEIEVEVEEPEQQSIFSGEEEPAASLRALNGEPATAAEETVTEIDSTEESDAANITAKADQLQEPEASRRALEGKPTPTPKKSNNPKRIIQATAEEEVEVPSPSDSAGNDTDDTTENDSASPPPPVSNLHKSYQKKLKANRPAVGKKKQ